jgi:hypothetical protein
MPQRTPPHSPDPEQKFLSKLVQLSRWAKEELGEEIIEVYDMSLAPYGYPAAIKAIDQFIMSLKGRPRMPSPAELVAILAPKEDPENEAQEAAARIIAAISRFGPYRVKDARAFIGELGWAVVLKDGGWENVCSVTSDQLPAVRAQYRKMALSSYERAKLGMHDHAPALPEPEISEQGMATLSDIMKRLEDRREKGEP